MRLLLALALLALAHPLSAQPVSDPLDWHGYFPLEVGNGWETLVTTQNANGAPPTTATTWAELVGEAPTPRGHGFIRRMRTVFRNAPPTLVDTTIIDTLLYDETLRRVVDVRRRPVTEMLGASLDTTATPAVSLAPRSVFGVVVPVKRFFRKLSNGGSVAFEYAYSIGYLRRDCGTGPCSTVLTYARVGGTEYGQRTVSALEVDRSASKALRVYPNPVSRGAVVYVDGVTAEGAEVFDLLGRRVLRAVTPEEGRAALPLDGLPAGQYVVRVGSAVRVLVVR